MVERILTYSEGTYLSIEDGDGRWYVIDADVAACLPPPPGGVAADHGLIDAQNAPPEDVTATGALVLGVTRLARPPRYRLVSLDGRDNLELTPCEYASLRAAGRLALRLPIGPGEWAETRTGRRGAPGTALHLPG